MELSYAINQKTVGLELRLTFDTTTSVAFKKNHSTRDASTSAVSSLFGNSKDRESM